MIGYTTREHLILDLDKTHSLFVTEKLIRMIQYDYQDVGCALISESSYDGYHVIFDSKISWKRILQICRTLTGLNVLNRNFVKIRNFREDLTLRVSSIDRGEEKSEAPKPIQIILCENCRDGFDLEYQRYPCVPLWNWIGEDDDGKFSGISEYLELLSVSRTLGSLSIPVS